MTNGLVTGQQVPPAVPETGLDQILLHVVNNTEKLKGNLQTLRAFLSRTLGANLSSPSSADAAEASPGILHAVEVALDAQSRVLDELNEAVDALAKIG